LDHIKTHLKMLIKNTIKYLLLGVLVKIYDYMIIFTQKSFSVCTVSTSTFSQKKLYNLLRVWDDDFIQKKVWDDGNFLLFE